LRKQGRKILLLPSSDWSEIERAATLLRVPAWLKQTRIIAWGPLVGTTAGCSAELIKQGLGADVVPYTDSQVKDLWKQVDPAAAEAEAQQYWLSQAKKIVEPTREKIVESAKLFLAVKGLMVREKAQAIASSHCMGDPRGCLTFSKLNDLGFVGACEGDIDSTLTMLLFAYAFQVPGFISDPVIDVKRNALLHFHCTSVTKADGPNGSRLPFAIRSQCDSKAGVALEVQHRVGQVVTCGKLVNLDTLLVTPGKILETSTNPMACRTQFAQSVTDAKRLFLNYARPIQGGVMAKLHRVVFYGDYLEQLRDLGDLMGLKVVQEDAAA
jgi:L-fucose isomerase-like protein